MTAKKRLILALCPAVMALLALSAGSRGSKAPIVLKEAFTAAAVEDGRPVGAGDKFDSASGHVICWTDAAASEVPTTITHVWRYRDKVVARNRVKIERRRSGAWSRRPVYPAWIGEWRVDVEDPEGRVLASLPFIVY